MVSSDSRRPQDNGRVRWLGAGQELLRRGGVREVKIAALCEVSGLTTGSFYHHFSGMSEFLDELARYYGTEQVDEHLRGLAAKAPRQRLEGLAAIAQDARMQPLDSAMRAWADSNELAAQAVAASDAALFEFVAGALCELGHGRDEAHIRASVLLSVGTARMRPPWDLPPDTSGRILDIVVDAP